MGASEESLFCNQKRGGWLCLGINANSDRGSRLGIKSKHFFIFAFREKKTRARLSGENTHFNANEDAALCLSLQQPLCSLEFNIKICAADLYSMTK